VKIGGWSILEADLARGIDSTAVVLKNGEISKDNGTAVIGVKMRDFAVTGLLASCLTGCNNSMKENSPLLGWGISDSVISCCSCSSISLLVVSTVASVEVDSASKTLDSLIDVDAASVDNVLKLGDTSLTTLEILEEYSVISTILDMVVDSSTILVEDSEVVNVADELEDCATSLTIVVILVEEYTVLSMLLLDLVEVPSTILLKVVEVVIKSNSFSVVSLVEDRDCALAAVLISSMEPAVDIPTSVVDEDDCVDADVDNVTELG